MINYNTGEHANGEFEVMRESTAELFSHNVMQVCFNKERDIKIMAEKVVAKRVILGELEEAA